MSLITTGTGQNSYLTLSEVKDQLLDDKILALTDEEIERWAKKAFNYLETNYRVFQYPKLDENQVANFPRSNQVEVPRDIKQAQLLTMSYLYGKTTLDKKEVLSKKVGDVQVQYEKGTNIEADEVYENVSTVYTIMSQYELRFL